MALQLVNVHPPGRVPEVKASNPTLKMSAAGESGGTREDTAARRAAIPRRRGELESPRAKKDKENPFRLMIDPIME